MRSDRKQTEIELEKIYLDSNDYRSIFCEKIGSEWSGLIKGIFSSIENRLVCQYPFAKLNKNQSISFFICICKESDCKSCNEVKKNKTYDKASFEDKINEDYIIDQLNMHRKKFGFFGRQ